MTGERTFNEVKEITGATDGNLSVQISKMEKDRYIEVHKDFFNNKPRTKFNLTVKGKDVFIDYVNMLDNVLSQYRKEEKAD